MNNIQLQMADYYRTNGDNQKAKIYDFFSGCEIEDYYAMFDTGNFNDIAAAYMRGAVSQLEKEGVIDKKQAQAIQSRFRLLFDEVDAKEAWERY